MKRLLCILMLCSQYSVAQRKIMPDILAEGKVDSNFIPKGYTQIASVSADINNDNKADIILAITDDDSVDYSSNYNYALLILANTGIGYKRIAVAWHVIYNSYADITVKKNVVTIVQQKGVNPEVSITRKFRYQYNNLYLIGYTYKYWDKYKDCDNINEESANTYYEDINYITGARYRKKISSDCKRLLDIHDKIQVKPLIKIEDFNDPKVNFN
ncbi:MAG: hypothetical protein JST82_16895 [Bacteroidetes bacterium]|nr:hypothetical protein [Bacteroidota bacterium]